MKISLFVAAAFVGLASIASSQTTTALSLAAGPSMPLNRFKETKSQGFGGSIGLIVGAADNPLGLRVDAGYDKLRGRTVGSTQYEGSRIISGSGNALFTFPGNAVKGYLLAGAGEYSMRSDSSGAKALTRFGFSFGSGISFPILERAGFLEAGLHSISQKNAKPLRYLRVALGFLL